MYKTCQTEHATKRQRELEKGLLQLMLKRHYEDISVSELCAQLQIPRRAFYRYFSDKEGALYALIDHTLGDFFNLSNPFRKGKASGDLDLLFVFWYENRALLDALKHSGLSGILVERTKAFALQEGYMPRGFRSYPAEVRELALGFAVCGLMSMVLQWHQEGFILSPEKMTSVATSLLSNPLTSGR